jgi:hypothetical protein
MGGVAVAGDAEVTAPVAVQWAYMAACLVAIAGIFHLQRYRHFAACGVHWWSYNVLACGIGLEMLHAWQFGAPDFPSSRWVLLPALAVVLLWAAVTDWRVRQARMRRSVRLIDAHKAATQRDG